jgi:hypothetical protein
MTGCRRKVGPQRAFIQQAIHGQKSFTRTDASGRKRAIGWKTISQTESDKLRLADYVHMGKPPAGHGHTWLVEPGEQDSHNRGGLGGRRRPRVCPTQSTITAVA